MIGAGPAGLFLAHLMRRAGVACLVLERADRDYVEGRVRAGVLEQITVDLMARLGLDARLRREGLTHFGTNIAYGDELFRIDMAALTGGRTVTVYGQQEVMKDLFDSAEESELPIVFAARDVRLHGLDTPNPSVTWRKGGVDHAVDCDFIAGCDGSHGVSRGAVPTGALTTFERVYPFGWLGVIAEAPPCAEELIYCNHERGFALASMRSRSRSRYYIQCAADEPLGAWSDERFWDELCVRLGPVTASNVIRGPASEKSIAPLRSLVSEPMRYGRLFLAGDAAHIVPPTGAKGLNLAVADVILLSEALSDFYRTGSETALEAYSQSALARVWKAERFSWWFTSLTHRFPQMDAFDRRIQAAELAYIRTSPSAQAAFAENYVGLPLEQPSGERS